MRSPGIELDPVTARARLLQPRDRILTGDFARTQLPANFDLAIGNPPFSDRTALSGSRVSLDGFASSITSSRARSIS